MNGKWWVVTVCLLVAGARAAGAGQASRPGELVVEVRGTTGAYGGTTAAYFVAGKPVNVDAGASQAGRAGRLAIAISLARTRDTGGESRGVCIMVDVRLPYSDLQPVLSAATKCGVGKLSLIAANGAEKPKPGAPDAKPVAFTLWTPPRSGAAGLSWVSEAGQVSINMSARQPAAAPAVTYEVPGLLKASQSEAELSKALRALKAYLPDAAGLMILPSDSVPSGAVVATVIQATQAGFDKIGFLEVLDTDDAAGEQRGPDTAPADGGTNEPRGALAQSPQADGKPAASQPGMALASAATQPAPTSVPAEPLRDANTVIFIVDKSGSMAPVFQDVQWYLLSLIGQLKETQKFHVIMFSGDQVIQFPKLYPIEADDKAKTIVIRLLKDITASGSTQALPGLKRAEVLLRVAKAPKSNNLVVLISDGDFAGMSGGSKYKTVDGRMLEGNEAVHQWLREHNKDGLFRLDVVRSNSQDKEGMAIMRTIASENGGTCWDIPKPK